VQVAERADDLMFEQQAGSKVADDYIVVGNDNDVLLDDV
jgi:hypothetical protein